MKKVDYSRLTDRMAEKGNCRIRLAAGKRRAFLAFGGALIIAGAVAGSAAFASDTAGQQDGQEMVFSEEESEPVTEEPVSEEEQVYPATDFTLTDQYGETHTLSDYQGKFVFLNFWATWCPPCKAELPDIQALYEETREDPDSDLVILGVAFPGQSGEQNEQGVADFLKENGYTYPTLMDTEAELVYPYYITAFPTTYMIDPDGNIYGYLQGAMSRETMDSIVQETKDAYYASGKTSSESPEETEEAGVKETEEAGVQETEEEEN